MAESQGSAPQRLEQLERMLSPTIDDNLKVWKQNLKGSPTSALQQPVMVPNTEEKEDMSYPLTDEEALYFIEDILQIPQPLQLLKKDRLEFLNKFLVQMNNEMPFTNFVVTARVLDKDNSTSFEEGKKAMFSRQGGNCLIINLFTKAILDLLGFKTFHIGANNPGDTTFDSHASTIVCDLMFPGSMHLVDPGMVRPFYEAIPLDFDEESKTYQFNYLKCKLFKRENGILHFCSFIPGKQTQPSPLVIESEGKFWKILISYRPSLKRSREYFYMKMKDRLGFPSTMPEIFKSIGIFTRNVGRNFAVGNQGDYFGVKYMHEDPSQCEIPYDDIPYPLTRDEAFCFLENVLLIPDPINLLKQDRIFFLNMYIRGMITEIPFTNIPQVSQPMDQKHCPTFTECKEAIFSRQGGHCFYKNIFSKALLDLMGYKTFHVGGNNIGDNQLDTHTGIIVSDLTYPGSLHLAEPGTRRPLFEAIPLDFDQESPEYQFHFMRSKFFKRDNGILLWCSHAPEETAPSTDVIESGDRFWKIQVIYRLEKKRTRKYFVDLGEYRWKIPSVIPHIHQLVFLCAYKDSKLFSYIHKRDLCAYKIEGEDLSGTEFQLLSLKEMVDSVVENFPQYTRHMIQTALENATYASKLYCI